MSGIRLSFAVVICAALAGCAGSAPRIPPGLSAIEVIVKAQPKAGYRPGANASMYSGGGAGGAPPPEFEEVDYERLEDVVVWVAPGRGGQVVDGNGLVTIIEWMKPMRVDIARPTGTIQAYDVTGRGLLIRNSGTVSEEVYLRVDGQVTDLGSIPAGGELWREAKSPGLVEVCVDSRPQPVARVFVAPFESRVTTSGRRIVFDLLKPGVYEVHCWHPRLPGSSAKVQTTADQLTKVTLTVTVNALPKAP